MRKTVTLGRFIAFIISLAVVFIFWGFVFTPSGTGSNIVLGLLVAGFIIYVISRDFGDYLDEVMFHGGSRERAKLFREGSKQLVDIRIRMEKFLQKKQNRSLAGSKAHVACEDALTKLHETLLETRANWTRNQSVVDQQIAKLRIGIDELAKTSKSLMGRITPASWLSGAPSLVGALGLALAIRFFMYEPFQIPSGSMKSTVDIGDHIVVEKFAYGIMNPISFEPSYLLRWATPKPGDVVVYKSPEYVGGPHAGEAWIKRVIATAGQKVRVADSVVYVDGKPYEHVLEKKLVTYLDFDSRDSHWREEQAYYTKERIGNLIHDIYIGPTGRMNFLTESWPPEFKKDPPGLKCAGGECTVQEGYIFLMGDNRPNSNDSRFWGALQIDRVKGKARMIWVSVDGSKKSLDLGRFFIPGFRLERFFKKII